MTVACRQPYSFERVDNLLPVEVNADAITLVTKKIGKRVSHRDRQRVKKVRSLYYWGMEETTSSKYYPKHERRKEGENTKQMWALRNVILGSPGNCECPRKFHKETLLEIPKTHQGMEN